MLNFIALIVALANTNQISNATVCGAGVIVRHNGAVVIDSFKSFGSPTGIPATPNSMVAIDLPVSITLGSSLREDTPICFETNSGTNCLKLSELRKGNQK